MTFRFTAAVRREALFFYRREKERTIRRKVSLRTELMQENLSKMILWTSNDRVCRHLNEHRRITARIKQVYDSRLPVFTPLFNQNGRFYMLCAGGDQALCFLRMAHAPNNAAEIVRRFNAGRFPRVCGRSDHQKRHQAGKYSHLQTFSSFAFRLFKRISEKNENPHRESGACSRA